ncbi:unnamed protein product, partial [Oikopleura dioica]
AISAFRAALDGLKKAHV